MANLKLLYRSEAAGGVENAAGKTLQLGRERGLVLVLSEDGGRLQNGVAHQLAIATIEQCFRPEVLTDKMLQRPQQHLTRTQKCVADAFRQYRKAQPEARGMNAQTSVVWIKDGQYYVLGSLPVVCYNPVLGLRPFTAEDRPAEFPMYDGDVLLMSTPDRYEQTDEAGLTATMQEHANSLAICYRHLAKARATVMAQVVSGAATPEKPEEQPEEKPAQKPVEQTTEQPVEKPAEQEEPLVPVHTRTGHYETHDDTPAADQPIAGEKYWLLAAALMTVAIIVLFCFF